MYTFATTRTHTCARARKILYEYRVYNMYAHLYARARDECLNYDYITTFLFFV